MSEYSYSVLKSNLYHTFTASPLDRKEHNVLERTGTYESLEEAV